MMYLFPLQTYIDMAQKDKERYVRQYMAYQETDSYKEFMRKKYPGLAKKHKVEQKPETPPQQTNKEKASWCTNKMGSVHGDLSSYTCTRNFHMVHSFIVSDRVVVIKMRTHKDFCV